MLMANKLYPLASPYVPEDAAAAPKEYTKPCWVIQNMTAMRKTEMVSFEGIELIEEASLYGFSPYPILQICDAHYLPGFVLNIFGNEKNEEFDFFAALEIGEQRTIFFLKGWYSLTGFCREFESLVDMFLLAEEQKLLQR